MSERISGLLNGIDFSRQYTLHLLKDLPDKDWYRMPGEGVTHIAWQAGHLAWAQYRLVFGRVIGLEEAGCGLVPDNYAVLFGKGTLPQADAAGLPTPAEILGVMHSVHHAVHEQLPAMDESILDDPSQPLHPAFSDKAGALRWCAAHELVHAGQIALLRRLLGHAPLR